MEKEIVGNRLLDLRANRRRKDVAEAVGISYSALQMYENGRRIPRDDVKVRLARYYGVSVEQLFFEKRPHIMCG